MRAWGITDGSAGMAAQVKSLALALGVEADMKTVKIRTPYVWLPNGFHALFLKPYIFPALVDNAASDTLCAPWPELIITCGRRAAIVAMGLKAHITRANTRHPPRFIHIQDPMVDPRNFDVIVAMTHDTIEGRNVIKTRYALHSITAETLAEAGERFKARFAKFPRPYVAVLLGGTTNKYKLTLEGMKAVTHALETMLEQSDCSLLITPSRRTGDMNIAALAGAFAVNPRVYIYYGHEENPYLGLLSLADYIVVSNDSVNMMSEAHATGKPIFLLPLPGHSGTKPVRFSNRLLRDGIAKPLGIPLEPWSYPPSDEMARVAQEVKRLLMPS